MVNVRLVDKVQGARISWSGQAKRTVDEERLLQIDDPAWTDFDRQRRRQSPQARDTGKRGPIVSVGAPSPQGPRLVAVSIPRQTTSKISFSVAQCPRLYCVV